MGTYSVVVAGTDGSESALNAIRKAADVARDSDAELVIVTAYRQLSGEQLERIQDILHGEAYKVVGAHPAEDNLREATEAAKAEGAKKVTTQALEGDPVDVLVDVAFKRNADLLVVGNRGLNRLAGRILGSVPANVSHRASCDVLIVHTSDGR